jgi:hypothetical protein
VILLVLVPSAAGGMDLSREAVVVADVDLKAEVSVFHSVR